MVKVAEARENSDKCSALVQCIREPLTKGISMVFEEKRDISKINLGSVKSSNRNFLSVPASGRGTKKIRIPASEIFLKW